MSVTPANHYFDCAFDCSTTARAAIDFRYYGEVVEDNVLKVAEAIMDLPQRQIPRALPAAEVHVGDDDYEQAGDSE